VEVVAVERKKTSVYLSDEDRERLARLAEEYGQSQAWVLREALAAYDAGRPDRNFSMFRMAEEGPSFEGPEVDDLQDYNDWLEREMREGLARDYERQIEESRAFFETRKVR
jgi:hypothetical protein